jgi:hypothetical protein
MLCNSLAGKFHRDCNIKIERASMHCLVIACPRSFNMGLPSAEGYVLVYGIW